MECINSVRINPNNIYTKRDTWYHDVSLVISPANVTNYKVTWRVMDPEIASVNESGYVFGLFPGTTQLCAIVEDCCGRTIRSPFVTVTVDDYTDVTIDDMYTTSRVMGVGDTITLEAVVTPERAAAKGVIWCSTDPEVLSISQNGNELTVTALKLGNAVVVATPVDDMDISSCCAIQVMPTIPAEDIDVIPKLILVPNEEKKLRAEVIPSNATNKSLYWISSDNAVVTVKKNTGLIQAVSAGQATITVGIYNTNIKKTCIVIVDDRETVIVEEDDEGAYDFFKVTFPETEGGLVWKSVGMDLEDTSETIYSYQWNRHKHNKEYDFNERQLAFLYLLDPLGVTYYMKKCISSRYTGELEDKQFQECMFKDRVYTKIFGTYPRLIKVFPDNTVSYYVYDPDISQSNRVDYYTDAEVLFGGHKIYDWLAWANLILNYGIPVVTSLIVAIYPPLGYVLATVEACHFAFFSGAVNDTLSSGTSYSMSEYMQTFIGQESNKKSFSYAFGWLTFALGAIVSIVEGLNVFTPALDEKVNRCSDYRVVLKNGARSLTMHELVDYCMN